MTLRVAELESLFTANLQDLERGAKTAETIQKKIDGSTATLKVDADADAASRAIEDVQDQVDGLNDTVARPRIDPQGLQDFRDESGETAREAAASFDGSAAGIADAFQEVAASAFVGFGPAGAAAGLAAAAGLGIAITAMQTVAEEADAAKERVGEVANAIVDTGGRLADLDVGEQIRAWSTEIAEEDNWLTFWTKETKSNLDVVREQAAATGIEVTELLAIQSGTDVGQMNSFLADQEQQLGRVRAELEPLLEIERQRRNELEAGLPPTVSLSEAERERMIALGLEVDALEAATEQTRQHRDDLREAEGAADAMRAATEGLTVEQLHLKDAIESANQELQDTAGIARDADRALLDYRDQLVATREAAEKGTRVTRDERRSLLDLADSAIEAAGAQEEAEGSARAWNTTIRKQRQDFIATAKQIGLTAQEARELADRYGLIPKTLTTDVTADTSSAKRAIADLLATPDIVIGVDVKREGYYANRAFGGSVIGPGTATSDSIPARLSNGEHVLTASDVVKAGGQAAVYRMRAAIQAGELRFAAGGAVGAASDDVEQARRELRRAREAAARARTEATERRVEQAETRLDDARARLDRLRAERDEFLTDRRRGDIRDSVTGGLDSALGVTDRLRDLASSGDLGRWRSDRLQGIAGRAESALSSLYRDADRAEKRLAAARDRLAEMRQIQEGARSSIVGGFSLEAPGAVNEFGERVAGGSTAQAIAASARAYAAKAARFPGLLERLRRMTGSAAIVQEVLGRGIEAGVPLAETLLSDLPALKSLAADLDAIDQAGLRAGSVVARAVTGRSIASAEDAVRSAKATAEELDGHVGKWSKVLANEIARALGVKPRANGGPVMAGGLYLVNENTPQSELFMPSQDGTILNRSQMGALGGPTTATFTDAQVATLAAAIRAGAAAGLAGYEQAQDRQALYVGGL